MKLMQHKILFFCIFSVLLHCFILSEEYIAGHIVIEGLVIIKTIETHDIQEDMFNVKSCLIFVWKSMICAFQSVITQTYFHIGIAEKRTNKKKLYNTIDFFNII